MSNDSQKDNKAETNSNSDIAKNDHSNAVSQPKRFRRFLFWTILLFTTLPPVVLSVWLNSKGIHLNSVSGLHFKHGLSAKKISVSINDTKLEFNNLSLQRRLDKTSGDVSYHIVATKTKLLLPPAATSMLKENNVQLNYIHFYDADFKFTQFKAPLRFSAHARKVTASALHTNSVSGWPNAIQILEDVNVDFNSDPDIALSGTVKHGVITLFFPDYNPSPHYRLPFNDGNFSIAWKQDSTPLKINIGSLVPEWETLYSILEKQIITKMAFAIDFHDPIDSMVLTTDKFHIEEPKYLPQFVERADINNKGYHLGQTIANLAQLPMHKFKVKSFTYGDLILDAKVVLETPLTNTNGKTEQKKHKKKTGKKLVTQKQIDRKKAIDQAKQQAKDLNITEEARTKAKFIVRGKALAPNPYDLDVTVRHLTKIDAWVNTHLTRSDGNTLYCESKILFKQPLPTYFNCNANFKDTKEFTDRLGLTELPNAKINGPLRIWAKQTSAPLDAPKNKSMLLNNKLATAYYDVGFELPESFEIALNKYALPAGLFKKFNGEHADQSKNKQLADVKMISDGRIEFNVNFYDKLLRVNLKDDSKKISFVNKKTQSAINLNFKDLSCLYPNLQCHINAEIEAKADKIYPMPNSLIKNFNFRTNMVATWANNLLVAKMAKNNISMDNVDVQSIPGFQKSQSKNVNFQLDSLVGLYTQNKQGTVGTFTIYQPADTKASLNSEFVVNRQEGAHSDENRHQSLSRYRADLGIKVNNFYLSQDLKLDDDTPLENVKPNADSANKVPSSKVCNPIIVSLHTPPYKRTRAYSVEELIKHNVYLTTAVTQLNVCKRMSLFTVPLREGIHNPDAFLAKSVSDTSGNINHNKEIDVTLKPLIIRSDYGIVFNVQRNQLKLGKIYSDGHVQLLGNELTLNNQFKNSRKALFADIDLHSNFDSGNSHIKLQRHTFNFTPEQDLKSYYIPVLPIDLNITHGQLTTSADIHINKDAQITGSIGLSSKGITGAYEGYRFGNVHSNVQLALMASNLKTQAPLEISADYLDVGIPMSNPRFVADFDTAKQYYHIAHGSTELYGGNVTITPLTITSLSNIKEVPLKVTGVDLKRVMAIADQDNIELTGKVDGVIPIALDNGSIVIRNASLDTRKPGGVLRYIEGSSIDKKIKAADASSPLNIAKVLENYHYNSIALAFDYAKNGDLSLTTEIKGQNPDFQNGRPIHLNVNLNDNIPKLLRSKDMIYSSNLVAQIKQQLGIQE